MTGMVRKLCRVQDKRITPSDGLFIKQKDNGNSIPSILLH